MQLFLRVEESKGVQFTDSIPVGNGSDPQYDLLNMILLSHYAQEGPSETHLSSFEPCSAE